VCAASKSGDGWTATMAIPFSDFGFYPKGGEIWRANFAREEKPVPEVSALFPAFGSLDTAERFGEIQFEPAAPATGLVLAIVATAPLIVIPFARIVEGEKIEGRSVAGGLIAVAGVILLLGSQFGLEQAAAVNGGMGEPR